jgi:hypothetical protein
MIIWHSFKTAFSLLVNGNEQFFSSTSKMFVTYLCVSSCIYTVSDVTTAENVRDSIFQFFRKQNDR